MGGGSSDNFLNYDAEDAIKNLEGSKKQTQNTEIDVQVAKIINDVLDNCNTRNTAQILTHLKSIKEFIEEEVEESVDLLFGCFTAKHKNVTGLSDGDSLLVINNCEFLKESPQKTKEYIIDKIRYQFPDAYVSEKDLAIKVPLEDDEIQLIPSIQCDNGTFISDTSRNKWLAIKSIEFAKILWAINEKYNKKIVPAIKIIKVINSRLPKNQQLEGYHIESLAIEVFRDYQGEKKTKQMLVHFFNNTPDLVMSHILDNTGQVIPVDDYLGEDGSLERRLVSNALNRISRRMGNADKFSSIEEWENILT